MSNFVLELKLDTEKYQEDILNKRLELSRRLYNLVLDKLYGRYEHMAQQKQYKEIWKSPKSKERNQNLKELQMDNKISEYHMHDFIKKYRYVYDKHIDSSTAQKISTRAWKAFEKRLFEGKRNSFKRFGEMNSVEGKSNSTGIRFKNNELHWNGLKITTVIKNDDNYSKDALCKKIKYCRVVRKVIRGNYVFYAQLVIGGTPPIKYSKQTGVVREIGIGRVGLDIGTQTIAISSYQDVKLLELAPEIKNIEHQKKILQRKLDRQRRANNPSKFNTNGTFIKGNRDRWVVSNKQNKTQLLLQELQSKQARIRMQSHNKLANYILSLGDEIYVEDMRFSALSKRTKIAKLNSKGKLSRRKRFGKSIGNKAPSLLLTLLDNKLKQKQLELIKINTIKARASQYNHETDSYIKKSLGKRWNSLFGMKIQRDLYSAFLIQNINKDLHTFNKDVIEDDWDNFTLLHNKEIQRIELNDNKIKSMGI